MLYSIQLFNRVPSPKKGEWLTQQYDLLDNGKLAVSGDEKRYSSKDFQVAKFRARIQLMENTRDFDWVEVVSYRLDPDPEMAGLFGKEVDPDDVWETAHKSVYKFTRKELYQRLEND